MKASPHLLLIPAAAILLALVLLAAARLIRRRTGIPEGKIVYADPGLWGRVEKPLYDSGLGLTGKPDYLVKKNGLYIPVEVKSMWAPGTPYDSHRLQLGAYCLLVEKAFNRRPPYGLLRYRNRTFRIPFTDAFEAEILETLAEVRAHKELDAVDRSHDQPGRCARCGYRDRCDQRI